MQHFKQIVMKFNEILFHSLNMISNFHFLNLLYRFQFLVRFLRNDNSAIILEHMFPSFDTQPRLYTNCVASLF